MFHKKAADLPSGIDRDRALDFACQKVWKVEGSGQVVNRMKCILNVEDIRRIWPDYHECVDHSWKVLEQAGELKTPPNQPLFLTL